MQAYGLAITISFLGLLLAAGALAAERDENAIGRLVRGLIGLGRLVAAKIALAVTVALGLGLAILVGFGIAVEAGNVIGRRSRGSALPLVLLGVCSPAPRSARSARSSVRSRASRGRPRSSAILVVLPSSSSGSSRARSSRPPPGSATRSRSRMPSRFFASALYDGSPWATLVREAAWLIGLARPCFGALARLSARRLAA